MRTFDFEALETIRELAGEGSPSFEEERSELLRQYAGEIPEAAARSPLTISVAGELIDVAGDLIDFTGDVQAVGKSLLSLVEYGEESASDVHELAEELLALVHSLVDIASHSSDAAENLITMVREAILE